MFHVQTDCFILQSTTNKEQSKYRAYPEFLLDWLELGNLEIGNNNGDGRRAPATPLKRTQWCRPH